MASVLETTDSRTEKFSLSDAKPSTKINEQTDQHVRVYAFQKKSKFVPRSYERIEKDQKMLLDCEDSWFDVSQDEAREARIPKRVLQDQIKFHESKAAVRVSVNNDESGQDNDSDAHEDESVNDNEDDHANAQVFNRVNAAQQGPFIDAALAEGRRHLLQTKRLVENSTTYPGQGHDSGLNQKSSQIGVITQESAAPEIDHSGSTEDESDFSQPSPAVNSRPRKQPIVLETGSPVSNNISSSPPRRTNATPMRANDLKGKNGITTDPFKSDSFRKRMVESPAFSVTTPNRTRAAEAPREAFHRPLSSSQTDEEDLELDIPHALGEEIHKSSPAKGIGLQVSPQQLPTRINRSELHIQVEKTPSQKKRSNIEPSTDVFIPGTYSSSQPRTVAEASKPINPTVISQSTNTDLSQRSTPLTLVPMTMAHEMQDVGRTDKSSSGVQVSRHRLDPPSSAPSVIDQTLLVSQASSSQPIPNLDGGGDILPIPNHKSRPQSPPRISNVREQPADHGEQPRKRRKIKDLAALGFSQEETSVMDRDQMVRANRREILRRLSSIDPDDVSTAKGCTKPTVITEHQDSPTSVSSRMSHTRGEQSSTSANDQVISFNLSAAPISGSVAADGANSDASLQAESQQLNLYQLYHRAYPNYGGTPKQFVKALVYLEWLGARRPHEALWDDFVRCYAEDYSDHLRMGNAERLTGIQFYNKLDEVNEDYFHSKPSGRIVTSGRLESALADGSLDRTLVETLRQKTGNNGGGNRPSDQLR
ncbi:hypothetical protein CJF30_00010478 [Rutstroemia sp. NJR-2017a BBW]|nr:hypothetical protein CJF30_00010478 [Rutstroemia sp. NJR-2017a BBW]